MKVDTISLDTDYPSDCVMMEGEISKREIAKLLEVTPARVGQYKFLPKPIRRDYRNSYYDKEKVLAAIAKQYPEPKRKVTEACSKNADTNLAIQFLAGKFDPEEKQEAYASLKYWARTHSPTTKRVRIKGDFYKEDKRGPKSSRLQRQLSL